METETKSVCPHCKTEVDPKANRCPHCRGKIYRWTTGKKILAGVLGVFIIFVFVSSAMTSTSSTGSPGRSATGLLDGYTGYLLLPQRPSDVIVAATTKDNFDQLMKLVLAKDTLGMAKMVQDGDAYELNPNTQIRVIDVTYAAEDSYQIRILSGEQYGQSAWVPGEFISPNQISIGGSSASAQ